MIIRNTGLIWKFSADPDTRRSAKPLRAWHDTVKTTSWTSFAGVRASYPSASYVNDKYVFNIGGNKFRLVCRIDFVRQLVLISWVGTHDDYDNLNLG